MRGTFLAATCAAVVVFCSSQVRAATLSLGSAKDNTLYFSATGGRSNGIGSHFFAGVTAQGGIRRGLVAFDVSSIPSGSIVNSATLTLHMSRTIASSENVAMHRVLADWGEGASNANNQEGTGAPSQLGDATWLHRFYNTTFWTSEGGDFAPAASATTLVGIEGPYSWSSTQLVADVQSWVDGASVNFGWLVMCNESVQGTAKRFDTKENTVPEYRPVLMIDYTVVPEPVISVGVIAACVSVGRRRRCVTPAAVRPDPAAQWPA